MVNVTGKRYARRMKDDGLLLLWLRWLFGKLWCGNGKTQFLVVVLLVHCDNWHDPGSDLMVSSWGCSGGILSLLQLFS